MCFLGKILPAQIFVYTAKKCPHVVKQFKNYFSKLASDWKNSSEKSVMETRGHAANGAQVEVAKRMIARVMWPAMAKAQDGCQQPRMDVTDIPI